MLRFMKNSFIAGLLVILPLGLTAYILYSGFIFADGILNEAARFLLYKLAKIAYFREHNLPGLGLVTLLLITILTGMAVRNLIGQKIFSFSRRIFESIPVFNKVYKGLAQISDALLGGKKGFFERPVLIEYPRPGLYSIVFITSDTFGHIQDKIAEEVVSVFLPTTPNPTSGYLLFVPKKDIIEIDITVEEAVKLIISGGSVSPDKFTLRSDEDTPGREI